jgi:hypothetical protein
VHQSSCKYFTSSIRARCDRQATHGSGRQADGPDGTAACIAGAGRVTCGAAGLRDRGQPRRRAAHGRGTAAGCRYQVDSMAEARAAADGAPVTLAGQTADVVRRQPDGAWRYVIDAPFGLA